VTFTATVTVDTPGAGAPTGTVAFSANGTPIGCTAGTQALDSGAATCTTSALPAGDDHVTATYQGDTSFATSASTPLSQQVDKAATATALSAASTNPSVAGQRPSRPPPCRSVPGRSPRPTRPTTTSPPPPRAR
jgi:hypothetical protein